MSTFSVDIATWTDADYAQAFRHRLGEADPPTYFDFTGCTLQMMVRKEVQEHEVFLSLTSEGGLVPGESGIDIYDPGSELISGLWEFTIIIMRKDLQRLPEGAYEQSLIVLNPDGLYSDLWRGSFVNTIGPTR